MVYVLLLALLVSFTTPAQQMEVVRKENVLAVSPPAML